MSTGYTSPEALKTEILNDLKMISDSVELGIASTIQGFDSADIIKKLYHKYKRQVVVLIDGYGMPVSENRDNPTVAEANRQILKEFHSVLTHADEFLRFVFLTGETRLRYTDLSCRMVSINFRT
jgi:hypothetical protein